jgi:ATP-dependent DNA ligase
LSSASPPSPASSQQAPIGLKYNGYRLWLERDGKRVRLITRGGYN